MGGLTIAYVTGQYARASDTFIRTEVAALRELGHTVHTFSIRRPEEQPLDDEVAAERAATDYVLEHGLPRLARAAAARAASSPRAMATASALSVRVGAPGLKDRLWPLAYLNEGAYLAERMDELEVQHLHDHIAEGSAATAMLASALGGVPFSMTVHGPEELERAPRLALDLKVARSAFTAAISDYARTEVRRWVRPEDRDKVHVVRCPVADWILERPPAPLPERPLLVSVGRLEERKGHLLLVEAAARLRAEGRDAQVVIVGEGPLRARLEQSVADSGMSDVVTLRGRLSQAEVVELVAGSRALVMPSLAEGLPVAIMEALALGRPAIATSVAGVPELVETGTTGWLVAPGSVDELAAAMGAALDAPVGELERLGRAGRARVAERHDARTEAARLAALFETSVGTRG